MVSRTFRATVNLEPLLDWDLLAFVETFALARFAPLQWRGVKIEDEDGVIEAESLGAAREHVQQRRTTPHEAKLWMHAKTGDVMSVACWPAASVAYVEFSGPDEDRVRGLAASLTTAIEHRKLTPVPSAAAFPTSAAPDLVPPPSTFTEPRDPEAARTNGRKRRVISWQRQLIIGVCASLIAAGIWALFQFLV